MFLCRVLFNVRKPEANQTGFGLTPRTRHWTEPAGTNAPRTRFKAQWSVSTQLPLSGIIITTHVSRRNGLFQHNSPCPALSSLHTFQGAMVCFNTSPLVRHCHLHTHVSRRNGLFQHISPCPALSSLHTFQGGMVCFNTSPFVRHYHHHTRVSRRNGLFQHLSLARHYHHFTRGQLRAG